MTTFLDGPLKGVVLRLRRSPKYLRATRRAVAGLYEFDALDQLDDTPRDGESLHCYYRVADDGWIHVKMQGPGSGMHRIATYALFRPEPSEADMWTNVAWRAWCLTQEAKAIPRD